MAAAPTETDIKERLAVIAATATGLTVLPYEPIFIDGVDVTSAGLDLLVGNLFHYGYITKISRRHTEKTISRVGATVRRSTFRINIVRGAKVDQSGSAVVSGNIESIANYFEAHESRSAEMFPPATYPAVRIVTGAGNEREDGEELAKNETGSFINLAWYQLAIDVRVQRGG